MLDANTIGEIIFEATGLNAEQLAGATMKKDNWIKCSDELPENDIKYLVIRNGEQDVLLFDDGFWCRDKGYGDLNEEVTHWQPLPKKPTK